MIPGSNPETILREILSQRVRAGSAPLAGVHFDARLPDRLALCGVELGIVFSEFADLLASLGPEGRAGVGIWLDAAAPPPPDAALPLRIELRATGPGGRLPQGFRGPSPALQAAVAALGGRLEFPRPGGTGPVMVAVTLETRRASGARSDVEAWGDTFRGTRLLMVRASPIDTARLAASLGALGIAVEMAADAAEAAALARRAAAAGAPFDFAMLCGTVPGERLGSAVDAIADIAAAAGGRPAIAVVPTADAPAEETARADLVVDRRLRWRRLVNALGALARRRDARPEAGGGTDNNIPDFRGRTILIAEDVAMNQALMRAMLAPTGATCQVVSDGAEAVDAMRRAPADLVLMDIQMPRMDGLEATRRIRALEIPTRIVALTAHASDADRARYLAQDMDGYLAKPIRVDDLYDVLRSAFVPG